MGLRERGRKLERKKAASYLLASHLILSTSIFIRLELSMEDHVYQECLKSSKVYVIFLSQKSLGPGCSWLDHVQVLSFATRTLITSYLILSCFMLPSHFLSFHISSHRIFSFLTILHLLSSHLILPALISSYLILAGPILSHLSLTLSHLISSPLILSYLF